MAELFLTGLIKNVTVQPSHKFSQKSDEIFLDYL